MAASNYGPHSYDSLMKAMNETTASERERFEAWALPILGDSPTWRESGPCELAWQAWQARAALPAPADQPPSHDADRKAGQQEPADSLAAALERCVTDSIYSQTVSAPSRIAAINKIACDALRAAGYSPLNGKPLYAAPAPQGANRKFQIGDAVTKIKGSNWSGRVVGTYSTELTPEGYAVESSTEKGSVQIYPASALRFDLPF